MNERPILFSAPMVKAILAGTKTQTRRVVTLRGAEAIEERSWQNFFLQSPWPWSPQHDGWVPCPYGAPGDRLWVKETWRPKASARAVGWEITYAADGEVLFSNIDRVSETWRRPKAAKTGNVTPLFMPRWASRITLEVTGVSVERLCAISEEDARAEGVERVDFAASGGVGVGDYRHAYRGLWESINGADSWAANPWVWRIEFMVVR